MPCRLPAGRFRSPPAPAPRARRPRLDDHVRRRRRAHARPRRRRRAASAPSAAGVSADTVAVWLFPPIVIGLLALRGLYRTKIRVQILDEAGHVVGATSVAAMIIVAFSAFTTDAGEHAELLARVWVFGMVYVARQPLRPRHHAAPGARRAR